MSAAVGAVAPMLPLGASALSLPYLQPTCAPRLETQPKILLQASSLPRIVLSSGIELLKSSSSV